MLIHGDCLEKLQDIESVDLVLADPPYGTTACTWDSIIPLKPLWEHLKRISRGAIVLNCSQPFTTTLISSNREMFKYCWIWHKNKPSGMAAAKYKPMSSHEELSVFATVKPTFNPILEERDLKAKYSSLKEGNFDRRSYGTNTQGFLGEVKKRTYSAKRNPTTVQKFDVVSNHGGNRLHPTQKPVALMEYMIKTYTNENDLVLDFCMGSGTTGVACKNLNRRFIGIEKSRSYFNLAEKRISDA